MPAWGSRKCLSLTLLKTVGHSRTFQEKPIRAAKGEGVVVLYTSNIDCAYIISWAISMVTPYLVELTSHRKAWPGSFTRKCFVTFEKTAISKC